MSQKSISEEIIEGLEKGDIGFADPGVGVQSITIAEYEALTGRVVESLKSTDFSAFSDGVDPSLTAGLEDCEAEELVSTLTSYARGDFSPAENFYAEALTLLGSFPKDTLLVDALASLDAGPVTPTTPVTPVTSPAPAGLIGGPDDDRLKGGGDDDVLKGKGGDDTLSGGGGDDRLVGGGGDDKLIGNSGDDTVKGGGGADNVRGGGGADVLKSGGANDTVKGGGGGDQLTGGGGDDLLVGGGGADMFIFAGSSGSDRVNGFRSGVDHLEIRQVKSFDALEFDQIAGGLQISFKGGDILLAGRTLNNITEDDFLF